MNSTGALGEGGPGNLDRCDVKSIVKAKSVGPLRIADGAIASVQMNGTTVLLDQRLAPNDKVENRAFGARTSDRCGQARDAMGRSANARDGHAVQDHAVQRCIKTDLPQGLRIQIDDRLADDAMPKIEPVALAYSRGRRVDQF